MIIASWRSTWDKPRISRAGRKVKRGQFDVRLWATNGDITDSISFTLPPMKRVDAVLTALDQLSMFRANAKEYGFMVILYR